MKMKKILATLMALAVMTGLCAAAAIDAGVERVVVGADLSSDQITSVYGAFGVTRGDVTELTVTNTEERKYLDGLVDSSIIGTRSISCVYIKTLEDGSGLDVTATNTNWCTREMYINALVTAGVDNAKVIVTAPFAVSGTAALTGIYKAYEDITGEPLDDLAKIAGTQELVITAELANEIGNYDAVTIVNELKTILGETKNMSDGELRTEIIRIAGEYNVSLTDSQVNQLITLCRSLEGLSTEELKAKVESVQEAVKKLANVQSTAGKIIDSIKGFIESVGTFFSNLFNMITGKS